MKFFALSKWRLIDKHFISTFSYATAKEGKAAALANSAKYEDQDFVAVVKARDAIHAKEIVMKKGFRI